jgi:hypothetical protein
MDFGGEMIAQLADGGGGPEPKKRRVSVIFPPHRQASALSSRISVLVLFFLHHSALDFRLSVKAWTISTLVGGRVRAARGRLLLGAAAPKGVRSDGDTMAQMHSRQKMLRE